ncbi:HEAT repeat-containing 3 [Labeo rohita]|uniref:HEAT repeat-containing 3 n=1 Tax=Labeo rohita TaxID=84645 RepID=A0A498MWS0_LABRO|nr:HEAT repeat-containing 3 [Labeo rohita]
MVFQQLLLNRLVKNQKMKTLRQRSYSIKNLSACGGPEVCEDMVRQDALTPLSALLRECCAGFDVSSSPAVKGQKHTVEDVANEAVNLLWNLCESSSTAVSVFNKAGLLDVLLRCLQRHPQNMELGISAGSLWNLKNGLSSAQQSQTLTALATTLSHSLSLDAGELIPELWRAESARLSKETTSAAESDHTDERPGGHEAEEMEEDVRDEKMNGRKSNGKMSKTKNDISDLLPRDRLELREAKALLSAQQTSLEIIVNMCCSDEPSDDEWEEMSSSDESEMCADGMMHRVQCRALTCLHNILSSMDTESLGGASGLQAVAQHLSSLVFSSAEALKDEEFLEAVTSALRSLLQIMATKNIPQLIGNALLNIAMKDSNLVVCGEALDALFDVFADGDEAEKAGKNINLLSSLKALQPGFRAKLRKEGRGKYSPDQLCVLDNIRINLKRFISYLEDLQRK